MKKLLALLAVCGFAFAFVACGQKTENAAGQEATETETEQPAVYDSAAATEQPADSVAADSVVTE